MPAIDGSVASTDKYPVKIFVSYAREDVEFRQELNTHLSTMRRQGLIAGWHDRLIVPGQEWAEEIDQALNEAEVVLLLISADFINSDYCYAKEMLRAMERHEAGEAVVIPIILRAADWLTSPFGKLHALPTDAKPIKSWSDRDEAWLDVVSGLRRVIENVVRSKASTNDLKPREEDATDGSDELRRIVTKFLLEYEIEDLFQHYLESGGREENRYFEPKELVDDLGELPDRKGVPRILELLTRIGISLAEDHPINQKLIGLFKARLGIHRLNELRKSFAPPEPPFYLFVEVPTTSACPLRCQVFDQRGTLRAKPGFNESIVPSNESIRAALRQILCLSEMRPFLNDLHIELFVPKELLFLDVDQEIDPHDIDFPLGGSYRVAMRWIDRGDPTLANIIERWEKLTKAIFDHKGCCSIIRWLRKGGSTRNISFHDWVKAGNISFFSGFLFDPFPEGWNQLDPLLEKALDHGLPFAVWGRECGNAWNCDQGVIESVLQAHDRHETLNHVREFRRKEDAANPRGIAVFWDDPERSLLRWSANSLIDVRK